MKNILVTILFTLLSSNYSCSQIIRDMAGESLKDEFKNGTYYIKDVNNYMLSYIGTWKYIEGNKEFRITLTKVTKYHEIDIDYNHSYYIDGLILQYQKYENSILTFTSPIINYPDGIIKEVGKLRMTIKDYGRNGCMFPVALDLISTGNNQYNLKFKIDMFEQRNTYFEQHPNEPYFSIPNDIIMTKI